MQYLLSISKIKFDFSFGISYDQIKYTCIRIELRAIQYSTALSLLP